jgi:hypothetical protein
VNSYPLHCIPFVLGEFQLQSYVPIRYRLTDCEESMRWRNRQLESSMAVILVGRMDCPERYAAREMVFIDGMNIN